MRQANWPIDVLTASRTSRRTAIKIAVPTTNNQRAAAAFSPSSTSGTSLSSCLVFHGGELSIR